MTIELENVRIVKKHQQYKESTEYAVFLDYKGFAYRLDWELADNTGIDPQEASSLMRIQIEADLSDELLLREISTTPAGASKRYNEYLDNGWELTDLTLN